MTAASVLSVLEDTLRTVRLIDTPFLQRWKNGQLHPDDVRQYGEQFRHFESRIPCFIERVQAIVPENADASALDRNLADEVGGNGGVAHVVLFDRFLAEIAGSIDADPRPAMRNLIDVCLELLDKSVPSGLVVLLVYEMQSSEVAQMIGDALRNHYGISEEGLAFWRLHAEVDDEHAAWLAEMLAKFTTDPDVIRNAALEISKAWMAFLDERDASRR